MADVKFAFDPISAGVGIGTTLYNEYSQQQAEKRAQRFYKQNSLLQYSLSRRAERESAMNQKQGLLNAGLSPALASEGKFSAPAVASAPAMPETHGQRLDPLTMSELMNQTLNRELIKQEIRGKDIENTRMEDEDATYDKNLRSWIDGQLTRTDISEDYRKMLESMRGNVHPYSKGSFEGLDKFIELTPKMQEQILRKTSAEYETKIIEVKQALQQYEWVARMDAKHFEKLVSECAQIQMNTSLLAAKVGLSRHEGNKLLAETQKLIEETKAISNGNVVELWTNGEWKKLMAFYGDKVIGSAIDVVGVGGKAKLARRATERFGESLGKALKSSQKFSAPSVLKNSSVRKSRSRSKSKSHREASTIQGTLKFPK